MDADKALVNSAQQAADIITETLEKGDLKGLGKKIREMLTTKTERERYAFDAPSKSIPSILALLGLVFITAFSLSALIVVEAFRLSESELPVERLILIGSIGMIILNLIIITTSIRRVRFIRRYDCYLSILRFRKMEFVKTLAELGDVRIEVVKRDLNRAVKEKLIPQGHFGKNDTVFISSDRLFEEYLQHKAIYDRTFRRIEEERRAMNERTKETEEILAQGRDYIDQIHESKMIIANKDISMKLGRMERIVTAIFHEVDLHPSHARSLGLFMEYYLPTTEKLLEAYIDLDEKEEKGKRIKKSQKEIEHALDTINDAYENILDGFFEEQELAISSEVSAMETIMKQEGISNDSAEHRIGQNR